MLPRVNEVLLFRNVGLVICEPHVGLPIGLCSLVHFIKFARQTFAVTARAAISDIDFSIRNGRTVGLVEISIQCR